MQRGPPCHLDGSAEGARGAAVGEPGRGARPADASDPAVGPDGIVWYTDQSNSFIGRLDPATGKITDAPTPTPQSGPHGIVVAPDGTAWKYRGGGPGLGVSGSGDVLAGIIGGLLARGAAPLTALLWGVWLHGEAGRSLARKTGPLGFLAREIPAEVPALLP